MRRAVRARRGANKKLLLAVGYSRDGGECDGLEHVTALNPSPEPLLRWPELRLAARCHPAGLVDDEAWAVYRLWRACRGGRVTGRIGGMAAGLIHSEPIGGHLPAAGGLLEQDAWLMAAFDILDAADAALTARDLAPRKD